MTTTVRSVRVELEMGIAGYIANARLAGRETEAAFSRVEGQVLRINRGVGTLDKSTAGLARTSAETRVQQTQLGREIDKTGTSAGRAEKSIDKYSGRLRVLGELALIGGPALLRLGAGALPVVTAGLVGLGAAAGGIGVTALAISGMKDAFKALNDYELERTPENLQKVQLEMEKLGPDAAEFVRHLDELQPQLRSLQLLARAGILPGFEHGIDDAVTRLPLVRQIVASLSEEVGRLGAETGRAVAGDRLTPFLEYIRDEGAPTLDAFAHSAGNVALGLANLLVAFDPATRDFTTGLEDMTDRFAHWSETLDHDEAFQSFLDTVRDAGPELVDLGGAVVDLFTGIVRAGAPLAATTVPILTGLLKVLAAIADSPAGPAIYTAAAAFTVYSRAAKIAETTTERIQTSWAGMSRGRLASGVVGGLGLLASSMTDLDDKAGLANTTMLASAGLMAGGPWGAAVGGAVGAVIDLTSANDDLEQSIRDANDALASGDLDQARRQYDQIREAIQNAQDEMNSFQLGGDHQGVAGQIKDAWGSLGTIFSGGLDGPRQALDDLGNDLRDARGDLDWFSLGAIAASQRVKELSGALSELQGWLDKRQALRDYRENLDELAKGLKDGFGPKDVENLDAIGTSIVQVANSIKDPGLKQDFLNGAAASLDKLAKNAGPKAQAQIDRLRAKLIQLGLVKIDPPKLTIDSSEAEKKIAMSKLGLRELHTMQARPHIGADSSEAERKGNAVKVLMRQLAAAHADPKVTVDPGNSLGILGMIRSALGSLHDRSITVTTTQINRLPQQVATGGYITGPGGPTDDRIPAMLSNGEYVMRAAAVQKYGLKAMSSMNALRLADGGPVRRSSGGMTNPFSDAYQPFNLVAGAAHEAAGGLKSLRRESHELEKQQSKLEKRIDRLTSKRDDVQSRYDDISSTVVGNLTSDIFAPSEGSTNPWAAGARPGGIIDPISALERDIGNITKYDTLRAQLQSRGLSGSALEAVSRQGTDALSQVAGYSDADLARFQQLYTQREQMAAASGGAAANAVVGEQLAGANDRLDRANDHLHDVVHRLHEVEKAIDRANKDNKQGHKDSAEHVGQSFGASARNARRKARRPR